MELVPYTFSDLPEYPRPPSGPRCTHPGQAQGIYITLHPDTVEEVAARFERWFAGRDDVCIIDSGTSDKAGFGFVLMEWMECEIDELFLSILQDEQTIADYTLYGRTLEGEPHVW